MADVSVIAVGDFTSWVKPSSVIVESQEECGFSKSVSKSRSTKKISMRFNSANIKYYLYKVVKPFIRNRRDFCIKTTTTTNKETNKNKQNKTKKY